MTARSELHAAFAARFHGGKRLRPATAGQLADAEAALSVLWPESYRQFAMACGEAYTPSLLDLIVKQKLRFSAVQQFLTLRQSVTETRRWHQEPEGRCAAIASDCSGSFFAFRKLTTTEPRPDDAPVWRFDHDAGEAVEQGGIVRPMDQSVPAALKVPATRL